MTPFSYLQQKRAETARRLLQSTELSLDQLASKTGFESRSTMFRQLQRFAGANLRALRRRAQPAVAAEADRGGPLHS